LGTGIKQKLVTEETGGRTKFRRLMRSNFGKRDAGTELTKKDKEESWENEHGRGKELYGRGVGMTAERRRGRDCQMLGAVIIRKRKKERGAPGERKNYNSQTTKKREDGYQFIHRLGKNRDEQEPNRLWESSKKLTAKLRFYTRGTASKEGR